MCVCGKAPAIFDVFAQKPVYKHVYVKFYVFVSDFDYESVKKLFENDKDGRKEVAKYTHDLIRVIESADDTLYEDVIILCLCVVTIDGKLSLREKNYVKRLIG